MSSVIRIRIYNYALNRRSLCGQSSAQCSNIIIFFVEKRNVLR